MQIETSQMLPNSDFGLKTLHGYFTIPIMQIKHFATASQHSREFAATLWLVCA